MKKISSIIAALLAMFCLASCEIHEDEMFDIPFVYIADGTGASYADIPKDGNNILSELAVTLSISASRFSDPVQVNYEIVVGNGLTEGVDFRIQQSCASPLTFEPGNYSLPIRILWYKNPAFDPDKDNSLEIKLSGSNPSGIKLGYPGPDNYKSSFTFTKK